MKKTARDFYLAEVDVDRQGRPTAWVISRDEEISMIFYADLKLNAWVLVDADGYKNSIYKRDYPNAKAVLPQIIWGKVQEPVEKGWCPDDGDQVVRDTSTIGPAHDPYRLEHLACGHKVYSLGPADEDVVILNRSEVTL